MHDIDATTATPVADLRPLLDVLPAAAYICDAEGLITYFNQRAVDLWGRAPKLNDPRDGFCGSFSLFYPDGNPVRHDAFWMALKLQQNHGFNGREVVIHRPDGSRVHALAYATPLRDEEGNLTGAVNVLADVTQARAVENISANLAAIVSSAQDAIIGKDLDGTVTSWNHGAERLYGYTAEEMIGQPITVLAPPDRPDEIPTIMAYLRRGDRVAPYETERVAKDGHRVHILLTVSPVRTADGRLVGASAIAHDITSRKRVADGQELLAAAGAFLSASLQNAVDVEEMARLGLPVLGTRCVVAMAAGDDGVVPAAVADLDTEAAGPPDRMSLTPSELAALDRVIRSGQSERLPFLRSRYPLASEPPPQLPWHDDTSALVVPLLARGEVLGAMAFESREQGHRYSTYDLALAEELGRRFAFSIDNARLYEEAQEALQLRRHVFGNVAHDLKNPLASISTLAEVLELQLARSPQEAAEQVREGLRNISDRARDAARQLDELTEVAALEAGQSLELHREPTDVVELARRVVAEAQERTRRHQIQVYAEEPTIIADVDEVRFERVLRNVLSNAVKYSPEGGRVAVNLSRREGESGRNIVVAVQDEGLGIPASDLPRIFDRFHRGANVAETIDGSGLGLGAVREIVTLHKGTIDISSHEGKGTLVTIRIPT